MNNMKEIRNGRAYPQALKKAALKASKSKKVSVASVANDFNISSATLCIWRRQAKIQGPTPSGLAAHQCAAAAIKAYNTIEYIDNKGQKTLTPSNATSFNLRGKTYSV